MMLIDRLLDLVETLRSRGIAATIDPRDLTVPGALVDLDTLGGGDVTLCGSTAATAVVYLVAADNGRPTTLQALLADYAKVQDLTTGAAPVDLALGSYGTLPALRLNPIQIGD